MKKLDDHDLYWCVRRLPKNVVELLQMYPLMVGGGYLRACIAGEQVADIDIFSATKEQADNAASVLGANTYKGRVHESDNAFTVTGASLPVQFIHRWLFESPQALIESFDFSISCAVIWYDHEGKCWDSLCDDRFYADLAAKRLIYRFPQRNEEVGGSLLRVLKYYQRGYRIPLDSLGGAIARLASKVRWDEIGSEKNAAKIITSLLREVDPLVDVGHLAHLPTIEQGGEENEV